jgi:hypothetical protein
MWPHLAVWEFVPIVVLLTLWRAPDWILKVLATAEAIRRFRRARDQDQGDDRARPVRGRWSPPRHRRASGQKKRKMRRRRY